MKIKADHEGRDDEYSKGPHHKNTVRYWESIDEDGYFYELYVMIDGVKSAIIVTDDGVHIDWRAGRNCGGTVHTNIVPRRLFGERKELDWSRLARILKILESTGGEGKSYTPKEMQEEFAEWQRLGEP